MKLRNHNSSLGTVWSALMIVLLIAGCTSQHEPDWKTLVGKITYDETVLKLGPPMRVATLEDGTKVAEWLQYSSRVYSVPGPVYGPWGPYGPWGGAAWGVGSVNSTPNVFLLLTFSPDQKLQSYRREYK